MDIRIRHVASASLLVAVASLSAFAQARQESRRPRLLDPQSDVKSERVAHRVVPPPRPVRPATTAPSIDSKSIDAAESQPAPELDRIHFHAAIDGSLWARGADYKARFDADGASIDPFFASDAPRSFALELALREARAGANAIGFAGDALPCRAGDRVTFDRGDATEIYVLSPRSIEQQFLLHRLPGPGEVVLRIAAATELHAEVTADGIEFANEWGAVRYGRATAIDARGASLALESTLADGSILLALPEEFLSRATLPILVDPVITVFSVETGAVNSLSPDVAYDDTGNNVLYCWEEIYNATDHDIRTEVRDRAGVPIAGSGAYVDYTTDNWTRPRVAYLNANDRFLIVAMRNTQSSPTREIWGRTRGVDPLTMSAPFLISGPESGEKLNPDVGGDPYPNPISYFLVVYERVISATDHDIHARLVSDTGVVGATILVDNSANTLDRLPAVSKSNDTFDWNVVWQWDAAANDRDIWAARVAWDGVITNPSFPVANWIGWDDTSPAVSSSVTNTSRYAVVFEEDYGTDHDIYAVAMDVTNLVAQMDLSVAEGVATFQDQHGPSIDFSGDHFLCSYSELFSTSPTDFDLYAADVVWLLDLFFGPVESHQPLALTGAPETESQVASEVSSGSWTVTRESTVAWHRGQSAAYTSDDILAGRYAQACGNVVPYCTAGISTNGCAAAIAGIGVPSASSPSGFLLLASNVEGQRYGLIFYGASGALALPWGGSSSFMCVRAPYQRMAIVGSGGAAGACDGAIAEDWNAYMAWNPVAVGKPLYGGEAFFAQCWYRDPPSPKTTHLSNALWFLVCP